MNQTNEASAPALAAHTPGPWRVGDYGLTVFGPKSEHPAPVTIAKLLARTARVTAEERKANAQLIASAPDLLAALRETLEDADATGCEDCAVISASQLERIRAAIAKATSRT